MIGRVEEHILFLRYCFSVGRTPDMARQMFQRLRKWSFRLEELKI